MPEQDDVDQPAVDAALAAVNVLLHIAAQSVSEVEDLVTTPQLRILVLIAAEGVQSIGSVAKELGVHPSNATRTCEKLVQAKLVVRTDDPVDRRYVQLALTKKGRAFVDHVLSRRREGMAAVLGRMTTESQRAVAMALEEFAIAAHGEQTRDGRFAFSLPG